MPTGTGRPGPSRGSGRRSRSRLSGIFCDLRELARVVPQDGAERLDGRVALEGASPGQHLEVDGAEREEVAAPVGALAAHLLGRDVAGRPDDEGRARGAGSWSACRSRRPGFSMRAMPKSRIFARPSCVRKMFSGLMSRWMTPLSCAAERPSAIWLAISVARGAASGPDAQTFGERLPLEELRDGVGDVAVHPGVVDREDVRVVQGRDGARLALESTQAVLVVGAAFGQHLQRHVPVQPRVAGAVDLAHAPLADGSHDLEAARSVPRPGATCRE